MEKMIYVAIADEHKIFRDGIKMAIRNRDSISILWEADSSTDMMKNLKIKQPDILLMDLRIPESGIKDIQMLRKEYEEVKIVVLSMHDDKELIQQVMENGANAYLTKNTNADEIYKAITTCISNDFYFNDLVNAAVLFKLQENKTLKKFYRNTVRFNDKELKILKLISEDKTTEEISKNIFLSPRTIETIRQNMKTKVGAKTIAGLLMYAVKNKLLK